MVGKDLKPYSVFKKVKSAHFTVCHLALFLRGLRIDGREGGKIWKEGLQNERGRGNERN